LFFLAIALLVGFDLYISHTRIKEYGPAVELNPAIRWIAANIDLRSAIGFLGGFNLALLLWASEYPTFLHILFGAKLSLAALQLKSLSLRNLHVQQN
jgi:hypothetical protein